MDFEFDESKSHCSNHYYWATGCDDCESCHKLYWFTSSKLQKAIKVGIHHLEIKPGDPGPKLQLIRQQTTRKIFIFLQNASSDVVKAVLKKSKELSKLSDDEKRVLILAAAYLSISWIDLVKEIASDLAEANKTGITNGLEQLAITKDEDEINALADEYAKKRTAEMVGKKWEDSKLVDYPGARFNIADTTKDDLLDIINNNPVAKLENEIAEAGIFGRKRAELIAKTEIAMAQAKGNLDVWKKEGKVKTVDVLLSDSHDVEDLCDEHVAAGPYPIEKAPNLPLHPNCLCSLIATELHG